MGIFGSQSDFFGNDHWLIQALSKFDVNFFLSSIDLQSGFGINKSHQIILCKEAEQQYNVFFVSDICSETNSNHFLF